MERFEHTLRDVALFADVAEDERLKFERRCNWRKYAKGEEIIGHQDRSDEIYFLVGGRARVIIYSVAGKAVAFRDIGPGDLFGELSAIDGQSRSANIEALQPSLVASMSSAQLWAALHEQPAVAAAMMRHLVRQVRDLTGRVFEFSTLAVRNRIHAELLRLGRSCQPQGDSIRLDKLPTHAEIASRIATHREAVTRELNRLEDIGVLTKSGSTLVIVDVERLQRMVHEATGDG